MTKPENNTRPAPQEQVVTVAYLAAQGDGCAKLADGTVVHLPGTLPGETLRITSTDAKKWRVEAVTTPSDERVTPPCPLFERCGGCTLQYMAPSALLRWKTERVQHALTKAGFTQLPAIQQHQVPPHSRRRVDLAIRRNGKELIIGLHARNSGDVVDLTTCTIMHPKILEAQPVLRQALRSLEGLRQAGEIKINLLDSGLDILFSTDGALTSADRTRLAALASVLMAPRINWYQRGSEAYETVAQRGSVFHKFGEVSVAPPAGAFLQATQQSEAWIQQAVLAALPAKMAKRDVIMELYAGCGTLSFPLATRQRVLAYEGYPPAAATLKAASGGMRLDVFCRDLNRQPIMGKDLSDAAVVVLDPPHAGAKLQMKQLANGKPKHVIYVSCNPAALVADAAVLHAAGYSLTSVQVVDQFLWSAEVEAVCGFTHGSSRRIRSGPSRLGC
ncbi:class I SAM-dependent RNA methyltransferase [Acetobacter orientalis]|uniref:class I SAM-dependent RNA methyltransferase n=1 Tax=Acetobacter orientalis TaxID=146474 RepID=UPI0039EB4593